MADAIRRFSKKAVAVFRSKDATSETEAAPESPAKLSNPYSDEHLPDFRDDIDYTDELFLPKKRASNVQPNVLTDTDGFEYTDERLFPTWRPPLPATGTKTFRPWRRESFSTDVPDCPIPEHDSSVFDQIRCGLEEGTVQRRKELFSLGIWNTDLVPELHTNELPSRDTLRQNDGRESNISGVERRVLTPLSDSDDDDELGTWPRRLLHVPTMTSLTWQPGNNYGEHEAPKYAAISYTWGRWRLQADQEPSTRGLPVEGVPWEIPRISEELFTVEQFTSAIRQCVSADNNHFPLEFIWLDVACIDQMQNSLQGAIEIGRQAKIFRQAENVFIWLIGLHREDKDPEDRWWYTPEASLSAIFMHEAKANSYASAMTEQLEARRTRFGLKFRPDRRQSQTEDEDELIHNVPGHVDWISDSGSGFSRLADIPWFTSLWTLQEAFLRPDAIYLDGDGELLEVPGRDQRCTHLEDVFTLCLLVQSVSQMSSEVKMGTGSIRAIEEGALQRVIERSGLAALASRNPISLYTAAQARTTTRSLDRIYGIMQVFDFRLGASSPSADPTQTWTLDELELQLGTQLLAQFPLLSQLHVHAGEVDFRQAWRPSRSSLVPLLARDLPFTRAGAFDGQTESLSHLSAVRVNGCAYGNFSGLSCNFVNIQEAWKSYDEGFSSDTQAISQIALDTTVILNQTTLQTPYSLHTIPPTFQQHELGAIIARKCRENGLGIRVWLLGSITYKSNEHAMHQNVGILVLECFDDAFGTWWKRLGVCLWHATPSDMSQQDILTASSPEWEHIEGLFG